MKIALAIAAAALALSPIGVAHATPGQCFNTPWGGYCDGQADGNGIFAQTPCKIADIGDGLSNTVAFSESLIGDGAAVGGPPTDPRTTRLLPRCQ